jgi:hypothetical protein
MSLLLMTLDGEQELIGPSVGIPQGGLQALRLGQESIQAGAVHSLWDSDGMGLGLTDAIAMLGDRDRIGLGLSDTLAVGPW